MTELKNLKSFYITLLGSFFVYQYRITVEKERFILAGGSHKFIFIYHVRLIQCILFCYRKNIFETLEIHLVYTFC